MKEIKRTDIGSRLWEWMKMHPMNASDVADKIGIARNSVLYIARGAIEPRNIVRCKIEKFLKEQNGQ